MAVPRSRFIELCGKLRTLLYASRTCADDAGQAKHSLNISSVSGLPVPLRRLNLIDGDTLAVLISAGDFKFGLLVASLGESDFLIECHLIECLGMHRQR